MLKEKIKDRGLKFVWVADKVGVSKSLLCQYLNGTVAMPLSVETKIRELIR